MWIPQFKTWSDKFFVGIVTVALLAVLSLLARAAWVITGLNIERWAESQGIDATLTNYWPIMVTWVVENSIWLSLVTAFFLGGALFLYIYRKLVPIDRINFRNPEKIKQVGTECADLAGEMLRFLERRSTENAHRKDQARQSGNDPHSLGQFDAERDFDSITRAQFAAQFGARMLHSLASLKQAGVNLPPHLLSGSYSSRPEGIVQVLAMFGEYLKRGEREEAISLSQDRSFMWQLQH